MSTTFLSITNQPANYRRQSESFAE